MVFGGGSGYGRPQSPYPEAPLEPSPGELREATERVALRVRRLEAQWQQHEGAGRRASAAAVRGANPQSREFFPVHRPVGHCTAK